MAAEFSRNGGGYGGVSEQEPPQHKVHTSDELLPRPTSGGYGGISEEEPPQHKVHRSDELLPRPTSGRFGEEERSEVFHDAPARSQIVELDEVERAVPAPSRFPNTREEQVGAGTEVNDRELKEVERDTGAERSDRGFVDDTEASRAFPGAPVDRKVSVPGYGYDAKVSESAHDSPVEHGADQHSPGCMGKMMGKMPGHHKAAGTDVEHDSTPVDHKTTSSSPKKGLMSKFKVKLPGHHATSTTV